MTGVMCDELSPSAGCELGVSDKLVAGVIGDGLPPLAGCELRVDETLVTGVICDELSPLAGCELSDTLLTGVICDELSPLLLSPSAGNMLVFGVNPSKPSTFGCVWHNLFL